MTVGRKPRKPLPRYTELPRAGRIKPKRRTKAERESKFAAEYGSVERRDWIAGHGCLACARTPCDNAHTWNRGKGLKGPPESIVPLCREHHRQAHRIGVQSFEAKHARMLVGRTLRSWAETFAHAWTTWKDAA